MRCPGRRSADRAAGAQADRREKRQEKISRPQAKSIAPETIKSMTHFTSQCIMDKHGYTICLTLLKFEFPGDLLT